VPIFLGTPGSSPAPEATLERGAPRNNQAKTENEMALVPRQCGRGCDRYQVQLRYLPLVED
jgi:hypothetical protein